MSDPRIGRVVADADVLAADVLVGGAARDAVDLARSHSWVDLAASSHLLADAETLLREFADDSLAADWRAKIEELVVSVDHPASDHPALASAYHTDAAHVLSFDDDLRSARTGMELTQHFDVSVKSPAAFARLFDPERLHPEVVGGDYPGPDRDPRA
jgi:hypothetical protein